MARRLRPPVFLAAGAALIAARAGGLTWRFRSATESPLQRRLEWAIYALWHEHLLPLSVFHRGQGAGVLVSRHRDGEILARVLRSLGYAPIRGSTGRGGGAALRKMIEFGRAGHPLAFTPDGPRGPRRRCQPGVVRAARRTGLPVIPVAASATHGLRARSWDRFLLPAPGTVVFVAHGSPLPVSAAESGEHAVALVERELNRLGQLCREAASAGAEEVGR